MLNDLRLSEPFLWVTFFVLTAIGVCAAMTSSSPPPHGDRTQLSDALAESLEKAISEGKTAKAHDLLLGVLKHPHLTSDLLLLPRTFQRCIQEHPEVFEAYYNLALADIGCSSPKFKIHLEGSPEQSVTIRDGLSRWAQMLSRSQLLLINDRRADARPTRCKPVEIGGSQAARS